MSRLNRLNFITRFIDPAAPICDRCGSEFVSLKKLEHHINNVCPLAGGANNPDDCQTCSGADINPKTGRPTTYVTCYRCKPVRLFPHPPPCPTCGRPGVPKAVVV